MNGSVRVAFDEGRTRAAVHLHHPKGNLITEDMVAALRQALEHGLDSPHLKLITLEGEGADFSYGASVPEHAPAHIGRVLPATHELFYALLDAPAVTAAVVRGRCLGGGFELALACDFIFAAEDATFGLPEIALGVFPPAGSVLLPARVGSAAAAPALLTGEPRSARDWLAAGLVHAIAPAVALQDEVTRWFDRHLAPRSASALRHAAAAARLTLRDQVQRLLPNLERLYLQDLMQTADASEGIAAFMEKRPPRWTDR